MAAPRNTTYPAGSNYQELGGTIWVVGGQLIFDTTTAITLTVSGGNLILAGLPTSDPSVAGALYIDTKTLKIS